MVRHRTESNGKTERTKSASLSPQKSMPSYVSLAVLTSEFSTITCRGSEACFNFIESAAMSPAVVWWG
eukprot:1137222-Pelagomonas_calceolata.AAC.10